MASRVWLAGLVAGWLALLSGCVAVPVNVSNPIPGLTTVAVAPFFNLSAEPSVDGRRFATAYFSELQKTAAFQVIPVGIVEEAIQEHRLSMSRPEDVLQLARLLNADAVVVGGVTDYNPYYPPQIGLQVQWYSPRQWMFYPGIPSSEGLPGEPIGSMPPAGPGPLGAKPAVVRGQSATLTEEQLDQLAETLVAQDDFGEGSSPWLAQQSRNRGISNRSQPPAVWPTRNRQSLTQTTVAGQRHEPGAGPVLEAASGPIAAFCPAEDFDPRQPLMSYTRFFDGADPRLIKALKQYVGYRGDMRSGGWEAHLHRSDDFIRFTSHRMIVEMLSLHGGTLQNEMVCKFWK